MERNKVQQQIWKYLSGMCCTAVDYFKCTIRTDQIQWVPVKLDAKYTQTHRQAKTWSVSFLHSACQTLAGSQVSSKPTNGYSSLSSYTLHTGRHSSLFTPCYVGPCHRGCVKSNIGAVSRARGCCLLLRLIRNSTRWSLSPIKKQVYKPTKPHAPIK